MNDLKTLSRAALRLQIARGSQEEVWPAFEELMRRNMEEEQESTTLVEITLKNSERWRKLHREDPDATIDIYEEFDGAIEELNWLRDKLEAVEKWCLSTSKPWSELGKILDRKFERSDASLISRHVAARKHLTKYSDSHEDWQLGRIRKWKEELESLLEGITPEKKPGLTKEQEREEDG